jgi:hypothetical protein
MSLDIGNLELIRLRALTMLGDINIGANKLKTTNLLLKQGDADTFYIRTLADDDYKNLTLSFLRAIGGGRFDGATYFNAPMNAGSSDDAYIQINAKDNGVGLVEVARFQGAADPYVSMGGSQQFKFYNSGYADFGGEVDLSTNVIMSGAVDVVKLGAYDISSGNRTLCIATEMAVAVDVGVASTHSLTVQCNGSSFKIPFVLV